MRTAYKKELLTLGIALSGVYATSRSEYGSTPCHITIYDTRLSCYFGDLVEGGIVVDKRPCSVDDIYHWTISGPMVKESLPAGTMQGMDQKIVHCDDVKQCGSFDYIAQDVYLALWEKLGAKIGVRRKNTIYWNNGTKTAIRPASRRYLNKDGTILTQDE